MSDKEESCQSCKHWQELQADSKGVCYCMPPIPNSGQRDGVWPRTLATDQCGQFCSESADSYVTALEQTVAAFEGINDKLDEALTGEPCDSDSDKLQAVFNVSCDLETLVGQFRTLLEQEKKASK